MLHRVPKEVTYEGTLETLEDCFVNQHQAIAYCSQLKRRIQCTGDSLQVFDTAIEQLAQRAYPALPEDHARREACRAFTDIV
jgi:hypothetical protein